jgi:transcriptional antiterminator NusG
MRRYEGAWHTEKRLLFPSYVFLESENRTLLLEELRERGMEAFFLKELGERRRNLFPAKKPVKSEAAKKGIPLLCIKQAEERFLKDLYGDSRNLKMSRGIVKNGVTQVTAGPLKGLEKRICRIERHKRLVKLKMPTEQSIGYIMAGLEITEKI